LIKKTEFDVAHIAAKVSSPDILALILNENRAYLNIIDNPVNIFGEMKF
jgi:hypothetical protein